MDTKSSYVPIAAAVVVGLLAGAALNSGSSDGERRLARRLAALEAQAGGLGADAAAQVAALGGQVAALEARTAELVAREGAVEMLAGATDQRLAEIGPMIESSAALADRVSVISEQIALIVNRLEAVEGLSGDAPAAPGAAASAAPSGDAAPTADAGAAAASAAAATAAGEDGLRLRVGQTGELRGQRVFVSFMDVEAGSARILAVGQAPAALTVGGPAADIGGGCSVALTGIVDGRAYLQGACAQ
jgi:hypothetical protein